MNATKSTAAHRKYFSDLQASFATEHDSTLRDMRTSASVIDGITETAVFHATSAQLLGCDGEAASWRRLVANLTLEADKRR